MDETKKIIAGEPPKPLTDGEKGRKLIGAETSEVGNVSFSLTTQSCYSIIYYCNKHCQDHKC